MPLIAKHINVRRIFGIWLPAINFISPVKIAILNPGQWGVTSPSHKIIDIFDFTSTRYTILWATNSVPFPLNREFIDVRRIHWVRAPRWIYTGCINPFWNLPVFWINAMVYYRSRVIVGLLPIPIFRHKINACVGLMLIGPGMSLVFLPRHWLPRKIPVTKIC